MMYLFFGALKREKADGNGREIHTGIAPIIAGKLLGQGRHDYLAISGPLPGQHLRRDALPDAPQQ
ncbi:hypothetical protein [Pseudomonas pergaminensis]